MRQQHRLTRACSLALLLSCGALASSGASADYVAYSVDGSTRTPLPENIDDISAESLVNLEWGEYSGRRVRVGVLEVKNETSLASFIATSSSSGDDVLGSVPVNGIEAIITDAMNRTGRFRLVERDEGAFQGVLQEQDLAASGRVSEPSGAQTGKVLGAEYLVQLVVTDYQPNVGGKDIKVGGLFKNKIPALSGLNLKKTSSRVGLNLRLIDAETSEVTFTKQIDSTIKESGVDFGGTASGDDLGLGAFLSKFSKTPVGEATIAGVNKAVFELVKQVGAQPTEGSVVTVNGNQVIINLGADNVAVRDRFQLMNEGKELIDPDTGLSLGAIESVAGEIEVATVQDKFSIARLVSGQAPKRGDKVVSTKPPAALEFASSWAGD